MARLIRPSQLRGALRRLVLRAAAGGLAALAGVLISLAGGLAVFALVRLWFEPLWAAVVTLALLALGVGVLALLLAWMGRSPPPPPATIWDWLLAGDPDGRPDGGLRRWVLMTARDVIRRPSRPRA